MQPVFATTVAFFGVLVALQTNFHSDRLACRVEHSSHREASGVIEQRQLRNERNRVATTDRRLDERRRDDRRGVERRGGDRRAPGATNEGAWLSVSGVERRRGDRRVSARRVHERRDGERRAEERRKNPRGLLSFPGPNGFLTREESDFLREMTSASGLD